MKNEIEEIKKELSEDSFTLEHIIKENKRQFITIVILSIALFIMGVCLIFALLY